MFGFLVANKKGKELIRGNEVSYLFIKRIDFNITSVSNVDVGWHTETREFPINISSMANLQVFTTIKNPVLNRCRFKIWVHKVRDTQSIRISVDATGRSTANAQGSLYVFSPATYIPMSNFGLALYNDSGVLAYHTASKELIPIGVSFKNGEASWVGTIGWLRDRGDWGSIAYGVGSNTVYEYSTHSSYGAAWQNHGSATKVFKIRASEYDDLPNIV